PSSSYFSKLVKKIFEVFLNINNFFYDFTSRLRCSSIDKLKNELTINRINALKECSKKYLTKDLEALKGLNHQELSAYEKNEFIQKVKDLKLLLSLDLDSSIHLTNHSNNIKRALEGALNHRVYLLNKDQNHPAICFLEELAFTLSSQSKGSSHISDYATRYLDIKKGNYDIKDLAKKVDSSVTQATGLLHRNQILTNILWFISYPLKGINNLISRVAPLDAKPWLTNNNEITICDYMLDGKKARFYHSSAPTGPIFNAQLNFLKKRKIVQLHHNLQHLSMPGEKERIFELLRKEIEYPSTLRVLSTPMDGIAWHGSDKRFYSVDTPEEFYLTYAKYAIANNLDDPSTSIQDIRGTAYRYVEQDIKNDNGFYVGKDVLTDKQFKAAFLASKDIIQKLYKGNSRWESLKHSKKGKMRLSKMMQLFTQGLLAHASLLKLLSDTKHQPKNPEIMIDALFSQACKQGIDRGVVLNVLTRLFYHLLTNKEFKEKDIKIIIGTVIARAKLAEKRIILEKRLEPLKDLLHFIEENPEILRMGLQNYSKDILSDTSSKTYLEVAKDRFSSLNPLNHFRTSFQIQEI
ncbi:MAG: hypothetical protein JXA94_05915, partial [Parachlamydiales bacterium]|nr:hypothetical protein [Parachlamydiales bacterium]